MLNAGMRPLFIATVGNKYEDWWKRKQRSTNNKQGLIREIIRKVLLSQNCPEVLLNTAQQLRSIVNRKTTYDLLAGPDFEYGSDRVSIRVVCSL